jgi:transcriptional regulator with XRE-family HTH domain
VLSRRDRTAAHTAVRDLQRRRAANVHLCMERAGSFAELARMSGMADNLLMMLANGTRAVSELTARKFEVALGLPLAWLDEKH